VPSDQTYDNTEAIDVTSLQSLVAEHKKLGYTPLIALAFAGTSLAGYLLM